MSPWHGFFLGIIQGLTEFLPVSSSGHLVIAQKIIGFTEPPIFFDVLVHFGTLMAVLFYFRKVIASLSKKTITALIIGTLPAALAGLLIEPYLSSIFNSLFLVSLGLVVTGIIMITTQIIPTANQTISSKKAIYIGLFQAMAIIPGISRSGSTIFGGLLNKLSKKEAFTFSFLLSIPTILGALILQLKDIKNIPQDSGFYIGFISAVISGMIAIKILDRLIDKNKLHYFGYYCLVLVIALQVFKF